MAFQNFAQKHSKSDMLLLILYCLIESFGSACSAVLCILYLYVWVIFSGGGLLVLSEIMFSTFWNTKYFQFYLMCKYFFTDWAFLPPFLGVLFFVCLFCFFCNAASPKACWELSNHYMSSFVGNFFIVSQGGWKGVCMALSLSVYCTSLSFDISIAKSIVFLKLHFDFDIPNISLI